MSYKFGDVEACMCVCVCGGGAMYSISLYIHVGGELANGLAHEMCYLPSQW